jgi:hypothetical protein
MRPCQRLACGVRAREVLGPVGHWQHFNLDAGTPYYHA